MRELGKEIRGGAKLTLSLHWGPGRAPCDYLPFVALAFAVLLASADVFASSFSFSFGFWSIYKYLKNNDKIMKHTNTMFLKSFIFQLFDVL